MGVDPYIMTKGKLVCVCFMNERKSVCDFVGWGGGLL